MRVPLGMPTTLDSFPANMHPGRKDSTTWVPAAHIGHQDAFLAAGFGMVYFTSCGHL